MSDLSNSPLRHAIATRQNIANSGASHCQWCSVPLPAGVTTCPTCGSPGIPDPRLTAGDLTEPEISAPDPINAADVIAPDIAGERELVEWWKHETLNADVIDDPHPTMPSFADVERRRMQSFGFISGAVFVCALLGWLIGPSLLVGPFEGLTGTTVEDLSDLRGMGTIGGIVIGLFIGSTGGWAIWSSR